MRKGRYWEKGVEAMSVMKNNKDTESFVELACIIFTAYFFSLLRMHIRNFQR